MKSLLLLGFVSALISLPLFAAEIDPRILAVMRLEQSQAQTFCYSFLREGGNHTASGRTCLEFFVDRYFGNTWLASKDKSVPKIGDAVSRAHSAFCGALRGFPGSGTTLHADCETWNRGRAELYKLGMTEGTSPSALGVKIEQSEQDRLRFCQSIQNAGNTGDPSDFTLRLSTCFAMAKLATATDRAILLGAF